MISAAQNVIESLHQANRRRLARRRGKRLEHLYKLDVQSRFEFIFSSNYWGNGESRSGNGSTLESTQQLRPALEALLQEMNVRTFLDAPCGDWNWMQSVKLPQDMLYIGGDIVQSMIDGLKERHSSEYVAFKHMNIIEAPLPRCDLWMCRDSLFHLSAADIVKTLQNFLRSGTPYVLLTNMSNIRVNEDIMTGSYRPLNLLLKPFSLPKPRRTLPDSPVHEKQRYMGLWHREDLVSLFPSDH